MYKLNFWQDWSKVEKGFFATLLILILIAFSISVYHYVKGHENIVRWDTVTETISLNIQSDSFERSLSEVAINTENYLVLSKFTPSDLTFNTTTTYLYFFLLLTATVLALTAISSIKKIIWFCAAFTFFIIAVILSKTDTLGVFGEDNQYLAGLIILSYGVPAFCFHTWGQHLSFIKKTSAFLAISILIIGLIYYFSSSANPLLVITNYGLLAPSLFAILFIFLIAYEPIRVLLTVTTWNKSYTGGTHNLWNFAIICTLYLANVGLVYFKHNDRLDIEIPVFTPILFFLLSTSSGVWGIRRKLKSLPALFQFEPYGLIMYAALFINCIAVMYFAFSTHNSSLINVLEDAILFSQLALGIVFIVYTVFNFQVPFRQNKPVYQIIYTPKKIPYHFVWVMGIVLIYVLIVAEHYRPYYRMVAAYHTAVGDLHLQNNSKIIAISNYQTATRFDQFNQRPGYSLAYTYAKNKSYDEAIIALERLHKSNSYPQKIIFLYELHKKRNNDFYDLWALQEGKKYHPNSGEIIHNIGMHYFNLKSIDSSVYYFDYSRSLLKDPSISDAAMLAFIGKNRYSSIADSLCALNLHQNNTYYQANRVALLNMIGKKNEIVLDKQLLNTVSDPSEAQLAYFTNALYHNLPFEDLDTYDKIIEKWRHEESVYYEHLSFLKAYIAYCRNDRLATKKLMDEVLLESSSALSHYYNFMAGLFMYKMYEDDLAEVYFKNAAYDQRFRILNPAMYYQAYTTAYRDPEEAMELLENLKKIKQFESLADKLYSILSIQSIDELLSHSDETKTRWLECYGNRLSLDQAKGILASFSNNYLKARSCGYVIQAFIQTSRGEDAKAIWTMVPNEDLTPYAINELHYVYLQGLTSWGQYAELKERINTIELNPDKDRFRSYFKAIAHDAYKDTTIANKLYKQAIEELPLHEEVYVRYALFLEHRMKASQNAYDILLKGLSLKPNSIPLNKQYCLQSLYMLNLSYAEKALEDLKTLMYDEEYIAFEQVYHQEKIKAEENLNNWE